jgi:hypothetical protein
LYYSVVWSIPLFLLQDAIAKYKSLPKELESMKYVLEMKNTEVKKFRKSNAELQHKVMYYICISDKIEVKSCMHKVYKFMNVCCIFILNTPLIILNTHVRLLY